MFLGALIFLIAYLLGSIPFGLLAGRIAGVDVRKHGSCNIGATNVLRTIGKGWGLGVFFADAAKGFVAVETASALVSVFPPAEQYSEFYAIFAATACVVGHSFPIWLRFRGGKGVATSVGGLIAIAPGAALAIFLIWIAVFWMTRYVSLASVVAAVALPVVVWALTFFHYTRGTVLFYFSLGLAMLVVWRHHSNIARLHAGTEQRFPRK